jgi:hypothetical protein
MKWRWKSGVLVLVAGWMVVHLLATACYTTHWPSTGVIASMSHRYMVPLFHQNWSLFAPNIPEYDTQLIYRALSDDTSGTWTNWTDVSAGAGHDEFTTMEVIEQNIMVQLNYQLYSNYYSVGGQPQLDAMIKTAAYNKALYFAGRMHEKHAGPWSELQIAQVFRFPQGELPIEDSQTDTLIYPTFQKSEIRR